MKLFLYTLLYGIAFVGFAILQPTASAAGASTTAACQQTGTNCSLGAYLTPAALLTLTAAVAFASVAFAAGRSVWPHHGDLHRINRH